VRPDAIFLSVVDAPQVENMLHVPPTPLHFQQLLVAQGYVFSRDAPGDLRVSILLP
jgi:hypothetical protein